MRHHAGEKVSNEVIRRQQEHKRVFWMKTKEPSALSFGTMASSMILSPSSISAQDTSKRRCPTCEHVFTAERHLAKHILNVKCLPVGEVKTYRCLPCDVDFKDADHLRHHCYTKRHKNAVRKEETEGNNALRLLEGLSGCEACEIESFRTDAARTFHLNSAKHLAAVGIMERRDARMMRLTMEAEARNKAISGQVEGCDLCGTEMFKSQAVKAAHLQTKGHLQAVEREERREQRRMGHSVRGRTCKAKGARVESGADRPVEDFSAVGSDGVARSVFHRVGRAFPKRQVQTPSIAPSAAASEAFPGLVDASLQRISLEGPAQPIAPFTDPDASQPSSPTPEASALGSEDPIIDPALTSAVTAPDAATHTADPIQEPTTVSQFDSSAKARRNGLGLRSVTDSINTHVSGLYFGVPERTWAMLKPLNQSYSPSLLAVDRAEMTVIKFGMKRGDTDRTEQHCTAFQGFYLLDHVPTEHMAEVEDLLKAWLRNEGLLFEGVHENRKARDTELTVVVTQADYERVVERTLLLIRQVDDKKRRLLGVGETTREEEARARQEEAKAAQEAERRGQEEAKAMQMAEKTAQDQLALQMAQIELEKLRLARGQAVSFA